LHNRQHLQINNNNISKLAVIILSIALITRISFIPVFQARVYAQQPQSQQAPQQQQNRVGLSQIIKQIAQQVATANPGTNATNVSNTCTISEANSSNIQSSRGY